jgi:hypothetical protein
LTGIANKCFFKTNLLLRLEKEDIMSNKSKDAKKSETKKKAKLSIKEKRRAKKEKHKSE